ncbi:MAG: hypothetical protein RI947_178 [Candidatus Parcubacteria bacterium]|jgi:carboxyl-terminal processing protease
MNSQKITNYLLYAALAIFLFGSGYRLGEMKSRKSLMSQRGSQGQSSLFDKTQKEIDFTLFWDTWDKVQEKYVDKKKVDSKKMYYGAIKGMVASVDDPYTFFLTPQENQQSKDDLGGKFEGIGAQLGLKENRIVIIAPLKNSPAEKAGTRAGDAIVKVDGQSTKGWTLPQAVSKIRGDKGTKVKITVNREGKELTFDIMRDEIKVPSVELTYERATDGQQVAHLKLNQFGENTNDEWNNAIDEIKQRWDGKQIKGMVLDLRDNPGGYLESAVYTASEFLPEGKLIVKQESTVTESKDYYSTHEGKLQTIPITVLINQGSASASEILAGALRDHKRATLIGEKSFGKGSVQEALDLGNGAGLHVTVAKWILPKGEWINGKGIEPEIVVENKVTEGNTITKDEDEQLQQAVNKL